MYGFKQIPKIGNLDSNVLCYLLSLFWHIVLSFCVCKWAIWVSTPLVETCFHFKKMANEWTGELSTFQISHPWINKISYGFSFFHSFISWKCNFFLVSSLLISISLSGLLDISPDFSFFLLIRKVSVIISIDLQCLTNSIRIYLFFFFSFFLLFYFTNPHIFETPTYLPT